MTMSPPPFDPELAAVLADLGDQAPTTATPDDIPAARERLNGEVPLLSNDELSCGGLFDIQERPARRTSRC